MSNKEVIYQEAVPYEFMERKRAPKRAVQQPEPVQDVPVPAIADLPYKVPDSTLPYAHERFVQEYVMSGKVREAYVTAFGEGNSANPARAGRDMLRNLAIIARLHIHQHAIATLSVKSTDALVRELEEMVDADINEFVTIRIGACRYCHGVGGLYLWRDMAEYEAAVNTAIEYNKPTPELGGGVGYRFNASVNPDCVQCEGDGVQRVIVNTTDDVSPGARKLFKGIECFPDGSVKKILLADQLVARQELHRIRGMHIERSVAVSVTGRLPDAKEIASNPERVKDFLEGLKTA